MLCLAATSVWHDSVSVSVWTGAVGMGNEIAMVGDLRWSVARLRRRGPY